MACNITVPALMANASVIDNLLRALRISDTSATIHLLNGLQGSPVADDPWAIVQLILDSIQRQPSTVAAAGATVLMGDTGYLAPAPAGDAAPRPVEAHATRMCGGTAAAAVPAVSTMATQVIPRAAGARLLTACQWKGRNHDLPVGAHVLRHLQSRPVLTAQRLAMAV